MADMRSNFARISKRGTSSENIEKIQEIYGLIYLLPEDYREILLLHYRDVKSIKEISLLRGMAQGNVKVRLFREEKCFLKSGRITGTFNLEQRISFSGFMNKSERNFGSKYMDITPHMSTYPYVLSIANTVPGRFYILGTIKSSNRTATQVDHMVSLILFKISFSIST